MVLEFSIYGGNQGLECVTGTQPISVAEYWNSADENFPINTHLNNVSNQISDDTPKKFILKPWFEIDNLLHSNGLTFPCEIVFEEEKSKKRTLFNFDPIFEYGQGNELLFADQRFIHFDYFKGKTIDFETQSIFYGQSISKGLYSCDEKLVVEDYISESQLEFVVTQHEDVLILLGMYYAKNKTKNLAPNIDLGTKTVEESFWFD